MESIDQLRNQQGEIDKENIVKIIPYQDPFVMIDRVTKLDKKSISATYTVQSNDPNLQGHFKDFPIMPGALIVEGIGQAGTLLARYNLENHLDYDVLAYKIWNASFMRPTFPGQTLEYEVRLIFKTKKIAIAKGVAKRKDKIVSKCTMVLAIVDRQKFRGRYQKKEEPQSV